MTQAISDLDCPDVGRVVFHVGTNDIKATSRCILMKDYRCLIGTARKVFCNADIALVSVPPQSSLEFEVETINEDLYSLCQDVGVALIDHNVTPSHLAADGVHLTRRGLALVVRAIKPFLLPKHPPTPDHSRGTDIPVVVGTAKPKTCPRQGTEPFDNESYIDFPPLPQSAPSKLPSSPCYPHSGNKPHLSPHPLRPSRQSVPASSAPSASTRSRHSTNSRAERANDAGPSSFAMKSMSAAGDRDMLHEFPPIPI